jgi:L-amino acid N-acyltransferase YncA
MVLLLLNLLRSLISGMRSDRESVSQDTIFGGNPPPLEGVDHIQRHRYTWPDNNQYSSSNLRLKGKVDYTLSSMEEGDWEAVRFIYLEGIATDNATFETAAPDWGTWDSNHLRECRLVARAGGQVIGWAALSPVSRRPCYSGVAENSVYVAGDARGKGVGKALMEALVKESERVGIWMLQTSIFPENEASIAIHKAWGFREVGYRARISQLRGVWRDTVFMERRSKVVGV